MKLLLDVALATWSAALQALISEVVTTSRTNEHARCLLSVELETLLDLRRVKCE